METASKPMLEDRAAQTGHTRALRACVLPQETTTAEVWDVQNSGAQSQEQLRKLNELHQGLARRLSDRLTAYLGSAVQIAPDSAEYTTYGEFLRNVPPITYMAACGVMPGDLVVLLQVDLAAALWMLDLLLGGNGRTTETQREMTDIEEQVLESVVQIVCEELQSAWKIIGSEVRFQRTQHPGDAQSITLPNEAVLAIRFDIAMGESRAKLFLAVPAMVPHTLLRRVSAAQSPERSRKPQPNLKIKKQLLACPFDLELRVEELRVPATRILELSPGNVLIFSQNTELVATMHVGDLKLFEAQIARLRNRRAAQILRARMAPIADGKE